MPTKSINDTQRFTEYSVEKDASVLTNGMTLFTITGGPIVVRQLILTCVTANDATASTVQFQAVTSQASTTFSGASASLASAAAGTMIVFSPGNLATAPVVTTASAVAGASNAIVVEEGEIRLVVGVGSTTGTWKAVMTYLPAGNNVEVY